VTSAPRTVLVTGASRGIGRAVATRAAAAGAQVALLARSAQTLEGLATELGGGAFAVPCDLTDADAISAAMATVQARCGGAPDVVVSNAGAFWLASVPEIEPAAFAELYLLTVTAPLLITRALLPAMLARGTGHFVQVGSIADRSVLPGNAAYAGAKHALRAQHEALRAELRGTGVRATLVSPGPTDTPLWDPLLASDRAAQLPPRTDMLRDTDVADAIWFAITRPPHVTIDELRLSRS
jgi:NADP-dependent 3-hydroxy acid dehydrogenase YdfG